MSQLLPSGEQITPIHWARVIAGAERIACIPGLADLRKMPGHPGYLRSDDLRAVTCPACRRIAGVK